ncbi:MAG TPA: RNA pseudouridine synthase [Opitutus sp.]|nr:RNA pseudouridine synthase [Opitutus sp.]
MSISADSFWAGLPLGRGVELLMRDENGVAALNKPESVLSHPNEAKDRPRCLLTTHYDAQAECYEWSVEGSQQPHRVWLLNRLDSATSGVILVVADGGLAREIRAQFKRKQVTKIYQALVFGKPAKPVEIWRDVVAVVKKGGRIRAAADAGRVPAESHMRVIRARGGEIPLALIQLEPRTGRSHQLRVQCAKRHLPIVGDQTYGDFGRNRELAKRTGQKRLFLHSLETRFSYAWKSTTFSFVARAPLPPEFGAVI